MATKMNPQNYKNMIEALRNFAAKTMETTSELSSACATCSQVLGADDVAAQNITVSAGNISNRYAELASIAKSIADAMAEELEQYYNGDRKNWASDDETDDEFDA